METMQSIVLGIGIPLFGIFLVLYTIGVTSSKKEVKYLQAWIGCDNLKTACAGSHYEDIPAVERSVSLAHNGFKTPAGKVLDTSAYDGYVVKGNSMQFCNIHTDDLAFVRKDFRISDLKKFPSVVVIRNTAAKKDECQHKVRRAWAILQGSVSDEEIKNCVNTIMTTSKYDELRQRLGDKYESDEVMISDMMERWNKFKGTHSDSLREDIVISTTYDVDKQRIHFSVHRASSIIGVVEFRTDLKSIAA